MNNKATKFSVEKLLALIKEEANAKNFDVAQKKIAGQLHLVWHKEREKKQEDYKNIKEKLTMKNYFFSKKQWIYGATTVGVLILAVVSVIVTNPQEQTATTSNELTLSAFNNKIKVEQDLESTPVALGELDYINFDPILKENTLSYQQNGKEKQLLVTDVAFQLETKENILNVVQEIQKKMNDLEGYLVSTNYDDNTHYKNGTIYVKVPVARLDEFQQFLNKHDTNGELKVLSYNVQNVSAEVVQLDETIKQIEEQIAEKRKELSAMNSEEERTLLQQEIERQEKQIQDSQDEREQTIAQYGLADVTIVLLEKQKTAWNDISNIDTTTFWGEVKYETIRALCSLVDTLGLVVMFTVWVAVYSLIPVPLVWLVGKIVRKIKAKKRENS
ncbi:MAG: hypothetical protein A2233_03170 [Candidatus Kerfeldbacteria bacterium RIFOXYA2_FULL_38_24]|uniref:DUF4349 domain-containing protein n=1 Tax=Candidatus Kerfeldbacteria bacterium RIFOXYB2_FULL_38_14 TaxID=1798547 RepID=A0A1G2BB83_9BACT|nr:MAG: hypothetical protein A2233_03170 [Candidatus Kerfeldbacteria bacterium RIFOXYA2_FULL_38_24]OGY86421.1 MAG: hypothetical protein A2319_01210 [Candidatus Kerfeldbacteria bacterium RIFOXYB2_FULL_38_14]OGY89075.1 MAG: hypothetical protein A2458_00690 [Candidatus Kerfeldbacteria bacterium RIFOXYC2_FULL_38_9]